MTKWNKFMYIIATSRKLQMELESRLFRYVINFEINVEMQGTSWMKQLYTFHFLQGGAGYAKGITFEKINLKQVYNPIIIDQHYNNIMVRFLS